MIGEIFYIIFIWPISFLLETIFVLFIRIFDAPGPAVVFLSLVVNTLILPIYIKADRWQKEERDLQKRMKPKLERIRSVFKGDEKQMIINAYYRQMGYSPLLIFRASVGLLLQIPFFIAAYRFLSHTKLLSEISFLFIKDLSVPDALISLPFALLGISAVNLMPFLMTGVNILSSLVYAKNLGKRELIQLLAMSLVFLVLLYNSPSGLVLYWTMNNLYSLAKNSAQVLFKKPAKLLQYFSVFIGFAFLYLVLSGKARVERYGIFFILIALAFLAVPLLLPRLLKRLNSVKNEELNDRKKIIETDILYFSTVLVIFLLIGILNPLQVLSASVSDFEEHWFFFVRTMLQSLSLLFFIPLLLRILIPQGFRKALAIVYSVFAINCLVCYFALTGSYGVMDRNFKLDDTDRLLHAFPKWVNIIVPFISIAVIALLIKVKKVRVLTILFQAACIALIFLSVIDVYNLGKGKSELQNLIKSNEAKIKDNPVYFNLAKQNQNVFIIVLDRAQGSALTDALEFMPEFKERLEGFTFYPNTVSFGLSTILGIPSMMGGYEYTPQKINDRKNELLVDKVNSAITLMPRLFGESGFNVTVTDPVIANLQSVPDISIFKGLKNVNAGLLSGKMTEKFRKEFKTTKENELNSFDFDILFRYGIFRVALPALRYGIYYKGQWWREAAYNSYGRAIGEFSSLYYLPEICSFAGSEKSFIILMNGTTHEAGNYNRELLPQENPVKFNTVEIERFKSKENIEYIYVLLSALNQIIKWLDTLKLEGVYDNTRIIIASDHGASYASPRADSKMEPYNPLLIIKDFYKREKFKINEELMTQADLPYLALNGIEIINSNETVKILDENTNNKNSITVFASVSSQPLRHGPYLFNISRKRELKGREIIKEESWGEWEGY